MNLDLDVQYAVKMDHVPVQKDFARWVAAVLGTQYDSAQLTVRIVDEKESEYLNGTYRQRNGPTNVLSFPFEQPELLQPPLLGDVVICAPVVMNEAAAQQKEPKAHWAHLVIHGVLHLLGYDHEDEGQAHEMESLEKEVMMQLGYPDPYRDDVVNNIDG